MSNSPGDTPPQNPYSVGIGSTDLSLPDHSPVAPDEVKVIDQPLRSIWFRPRATVRYLIHTDPTRNVMLLACLSGVAQSLSRASQRNVGDTVNLSTILMTVCVLGPIGGIFSLWLFSHLIRISGNWIGGLGNRTHIKTAFAWAGIPTVASLIFWAPRLLLFGKENFTEEMQIPEGDVTSLVGLLVIGLAEIVLGIWAVVLLCKSVAEVQGYRSAWKGLGNLLLAGLLIFVPIMIIVALLLAG